LKKVKEMIENYVKEHRKILNDWLLYVYY